MGLASAIPSRSQPDRPLATPESHEVEIEREHRIAELSRRLGVIA